MAIKAIINNTEKEIEQIKNSNEQDIDYVYSRIGDTEVEGEPPISIKSIGGTLADYRIYGQTVDSESVGDRTANLFDGTFIHRSVLGAEVGDDALYRRSIVVDISNFNNGDKITFSRETSAGNRFQMYQVSSPLKGGILLNDNVVSGESNTLLATITLDNISNYHYLMIFLNGANIPITDEELLASKIMLNEGSTPLPYEPYGYNVPVTVEGKNLFDKSKTANILKCYLSVSTLVSNVDTRTIFIECKPSTTYTVSKIQGKRFAVGWSDKLPATGVELQEKVINYNASSITITTSLAAKYLVAYIYNAEQDAPITVDEMIASVQIEKGSTATPYEPYRTPVTTSIYLPEQIRKVGDEAEYIDYGEQKQHRVRKNLLKITLASSGATTYDGVSISNNDGILTLNGTSNNGSFVNLATAIKLPIGNYILTGGSENLMIRFQKTFSGYGFDDTGAGRNVICPEEVTSGVCSLKLTANYTYNNVKVYPMIRKADITDDTYEPYITNTELDVTLPALSTIKGTNTLSVNTSIQPSNIYIKDNFDYKKVFTATRTIEGESPLNYRSIEDSDSTLSNYRIYGNTVDGESVGDRTGNLFDINSPLLYNATISKLNVGDTTLMFPYGTGGSRRCIFIPVEPNTTYTFSCRTAGDKLVIATYNQRYTKAQLDLYTTDNCLISDGEIIFDIQKGYTLYTFTTPATTNMIGIYYQLNISPTGIMLNEGSTALPYEPYGYKVPITVEGKNLLPNTATSQTINGVTFTVNSDGSITCNGTADASAPSALYIPFTLPIKLYELSGCPDSGSVSTYRVDIRNNDYSVYKYNGSNVIDNGTGCLFDGGNNQYCIRIAPGYTCDNLTFYPMIRKANIEDGTYEPYHAPVTTNLYLPEPIKMVGDEAEYVDYAEQKWHRVRKNLVQTIATSQTINDITFTVNANGSVTCNGTNHGNNPILFELNNPDVVFPEGVYITSGCPAGGSITSGYKIQYFNGSSWNYELGSGSTFTLSGNLKYRSRILISKDVTVTNLTFYPMLRLASIEDDTYEPYIEDTELDVTLPALPTIKGTNTLTVGTKAQPSDIYLKGKIKKKPKIYYKIYYYSQDGQTVLSTETVEEGHDCTYSTAPTKESDTDFNYTFTGWSTTINSTTATAGATENIQQNTNLYAAFSKSLKGDTISDSWEEIIANCDNGTYASKYQIGDLKTIDVGTEGPVQMQIVAIDTDLLASDNTKKAPITWISKQLLNTYKAMHGTSSSYLSDWANCDMRTYLRGTVLPMLPSVVQNGIKEVTKYTCKRTGPTTYTTVSATENIWLPSYREVSNATSNCETSGVQYNSIFTDDASRVKSKVGNNAYYWWTRSASGDSNSSCSYYFARVWSRGTADYAGNYCTLSRGVAIGFCT